MTFKKNKALTIILLIIFFIISILSIYSVKGLDFVKKQVVWYSIGFILLYLTKKIDFNIITDNSFILYIFGNILLFLLLIFGTEINGSKCWFIIPKLGSFQPSEFIKIIIILMNAKILYDYDKKYKNRSLKDDIKIFLVIMLITLIPSILTFLEPDTGIVIIYFLISFIMLYVFGIKKSIFLILIFLFIIFITIFLLTYFKYPNTFMNIFGTSFFYRIDRLLDWKNSSGMQINNAMIAIKAAGITGFGITKTPIYIPEAHTDFIFSVFANNTGLIGTILLLICLIVFDINLFIMAKKTNDKKYKFIIIGFLSMILYQQVQNIGMNVGLLPITGITLPFISYGGSSLLSYIIAISIIINYKETKKD